MKPINIEKETLKNETFRKLIYTSQESEKNRIQIALMTLQPGQNIGWEIHKPTQFFRVESGEGFAIIGGVSYTIKDGSAFVVPSGVEHNIGALTKLQLYTIYFPPEHQV